jgi:hypothetical protein
MMNFSKTMPVRAIKTPNDFENSSCKCIQQEMIMSTKWMDTSKYKKSKALLKLKSNEITKMINKTKIQRDLFE